MPLPLLLFLAILLCLSPIFCPAQEKVWKRVETGRQKSASRWKEWQQQLQKKGLDSNYIHALSVGAKLHTSGWSGGLIYRKRATRATHRIIQFHLEEIKHDKEVKQEAGKNPYPELGKTSPFIYGKINTVYTLHLSYGRQQLLFPALLDGHISLSLCYMGGISLGMLKPYYLKLVDNDPGAPVLSIEKYNPADQDRFLNHARILGRAKWSEGLEEIQYIPGVHAALALQLEPGKTKTFIQSISVGGQITLYARNITIMAEQKAYPVQASFFIGLALGKRW